MNKRKFNIGRQSEQLYNEELYNMFKSIQSLHWSKKDDGSKPEGESQGSLWLDPIKNDLFSYQTEKQDWKLLFEERFKITGEVLSEGIPYNPVKGQLWINQGMLWYYTKNGWKVVKAFEPDSGDVYFSSFEDFLLLSPMKQQANSVITEEDTVLKKSQFLTPSLKTGRYFMKGLLTTDYEAVSQIAFQYDKIEVEKRRPSWVHVNPGRLTEIKKRVIKIYRDLSDIDILALNTEFYGYRGGGPNGTLLVPIDDNHPDGDYYVQPNGIRLTYNTLHKYDYLLAISYTFSWIKTTGLLNVRKTSRSNDDYTYHVGKIKYSANVLVEGYDLEEDFYISNKETETITITDDDMDSDLEVSVMHTFKNEYGIVQKRTLDGKGVIRMRKKFKNPLVFVNGQAMHKTLGDIEIHDEVIYVPNARRGMGYSVIETDHRGESLILETGIVNKDKDGEGYIVINDFKNTIKEDEGIILFVDGLLVKKEDVHRNYDDNYIYANGLKTGQEYILIHDKNHMLMFEDTIKKAINTGKVDGSLVYMNGYLLNSSDSIEEFENEEMASMGCVTGEIKLFVDDTAPNEMGYFKLWNNHFEIWEDCDELTINGLMNFCFSYKNMISAITIDIPFEDEDVIVCYAYNFAHTIESPLVINTFEISELDGTFVKVPESFIPNTNSIRVYLDGLRIHGERDHPTIPGVKEAPDGSGFYLPFPFSGRLTYVIERPEKDEIRSCERALLTKDNLLNTANVYRSPISLYPGKVNIYTNGMRQPKDSYYILDNYTIVFKDKITKLIGHETNYPINNVIIDGVERQLEHILSDVILIEVRTDFELIEESYISKGDDNHEIDISGHGLPKSLLESRDQIMIYINGLFTSFRDDIEYKKNLGKGVISILDSRYSDLINYDPLHSYFELHPNKRNKFEIDTGKKYEPKVYNVILLEWR